MMKCVFRACLGFLLVVFVMFVLKHTELPLNKDDVSQSVNIKLTKHKNHLEDIADSDEGCDEKFKDTIEENLRFIDDYPGGTADKYMWKIGANLTKPIKSQNGPVIVAAASARYYGLLLMMVKSFNYHASRRLNGEPIKLVIYDLGLVHSQKVALETAGLPCEFRTFPFDEFPPHVRTLRYMAWKPILIQILLMEFGFVWWVDASVRFKTLNVDSVLEEVKKYGLLFSVPSKDEIHNLTEQTDVNTFKYLNEDPCKFRQFSIPSANSVIVYFNTVSRTIVRAWARCALDKNCILADNTVRKCGVSNRNKRCHRFDQSVLGILSRRVYHDQSVYSFMKVSEGIYEVNRTDRCDSDVCAV